MVRRSGDDAVVGRPLAERGVRDLDGEQAARRGASRMEHRRSTKRAENQAALGARLAEVDAADSLRRRDAGADRRGVRRDRLPEGRRGAAHDRELRRRRHVPQGRQRLPARRTPTRTPRRRISGRRSRPRRASRSSASCRRSSISRACRCSTSRWRARTARPPSRSGSSASSSTRRRPWSGRWQIPVCLKAPGRPSPACEVLTRGTRTITLAGALRAVGVRERRRGWATTAPRTRPTMLRAMAPRVGTDLTAPERLSLLDDEWALVRAGRHTVGDYLTLAAGFGREHTSGVLGGGRQPPQLHARLPDHWRGRGRASRRSSARCCGRSSTRSASPAPPPRPTIAARCAPPSSPRSARSRDDPDVIARARSAVDRALAGDADARADRARRGRSRPRRCTATRRCSRPSPPPPSARRIPTSATAISMRSASSAIRRSSIAALQAGAVAAAAEPGHAGSTSRGSSPTRTRASGRGRSSANTGRRWSRRWRSSAATPR